MKYKQLGTKYIVKIEKGDELIETLKIFCKENGIRLGSIMGLGASNQITLGLFKTANKEYLTKEYKADYEITSLLGNISEKEGEVYLHIHANIAAVSYTHLTLPTNR